MNNSISQEAGPRTEEDRGPFYYAADVAKAGYRVFPIKPEEKYSAVPGSFYSSTTDLSYIAAWLAEGRENNLIGIATGFASDLVVKEADTPEAYQYMLDRFGEPDATSKRGGHWYFRHPGGGKVVSRPVKGDFPDGLDCKADGGLVVCPPAENRRWTNGIPDKAALRKLPKDLIQREDAPDEGERERSDDECKQAAGIIAGRVLTLKPGQRHEHLNACTGAMLSHGLSPADAAHILTLAWKKTGDPELERRVPREAMTAVKTTARQIKNDGKCTGVPTLERLTPGLFNDLKWLFKIVEIKPSTSTNNTNSPNTTNSPNSPNSTFPKPKAAAELLFKEFPPVSWAVKGLVPEGVSLLAGKPKIGKSWAALDWCVTIPEGGIAFGSIKVEKGETLYLALEDNEKRMQKRIKKVLGGRECPEGFWYETNWPRLEEGGAEALDEWLSEHPDTRLVVIDTLAKIRKPARGQNVYAEDYAALEVLLPMAAKHGVAIVVVHHLRKGEAADAQDEISGSTGLSGGVDGYLILRRKPGSQGPTLFVDGRDIEEPQEYALHWNNNTATWTIEGTAEEVHISKERADILLTLNRNPEPMTPKEVADAMPGKTRNNIRYLLWAMFNDGQILKDKKGGYYPTNPTNSPTNSPNTPKADSYQEKDDPVSGVSGVSGVSKKTPASFGAPPGKHKLAELKARREEVCEHGTPADCPCDDCDVEGRFGGGA